MAAADLCTVEDVREFIQKPATDTNQDQIIQALITRASRAVMRFCEREFAPAGSAGVTRTFEYERNAGFVSLAPFDLQAVTAVQVDTDVSATTLGSQEYRLFPVAKPDGVWTSIRLQPLSSAVSSPMWDTRQFTITGTWGFPSVPDDVKHAAIVTTSIWLKKNVQAFSSVFRLDEGLVERPEALPSEVKGVLLPWKRTSY